MEDSLKLSIEQKLQQRLSPLQVRFGKMLEMSGPEVEDEVQRALDDNPALEAVDHSDDSGEEPFNETASEIQDADYRDEDDIPFYRHDTRQNSHYDNPLETMTADTSETLYDVLSEQLAGFDLSERQKLIARYIIGNLDDNGYLTRSASSMGYDIEEHTGEHIAVDDIKSVIDIVRSLEPAGIAAVDLRDCLLLQLHRRKSGKTVDRAIEIVTHYFDYFSRKHYDRLAAAIGVSEAELKDAVELITSLNPKPAASLAGDVAEDRTRHIVPDFTVEVDDGTVTLTLVNNIPELQIERSFSEEEARLDGDNAAELFIRQKRDEAADFIKVLKMRQETLYNVMRAIVSIQRDFFVNSDDEMLIRPMILKDIAKITGYDLSVISRAAAGKYVATSYGIYPLKHFFNEKPKDDEDASSHEIVAALKEIISSEDKKKPLSDEAITARITDMGYDIARRTVAKYREKLGIPVARLRKEI
ncbi:MAG: RNA polymerase factor sigma-54 [Bacteroides sp.]|nr:RNA polymerase factor sigma-54 [Bacteroides sp.]